MTSAGKLFNVYQNEWTSSPWTNLGSVEWLKLQTSNLMCRLSTRSTTQERKI